MTLKHVLLTKSVLTQRIVVVLEEKVFRSVLNVILTDFVSEGKVTEIDWISFSAIIDTIQLGTSVNGC